MAGRARDAKDDMEAAIDEARADWAKAKGRVVDTATMTKEEVSDFIRFLMEEGRDLKDRLGKDFAESADDVADHARKAADHVRHGA
jgi:gas vesicle protein